MFRNELYRPYFNNPDFNYNHIEGFFPTDERLAYQNNDVSFGAIILPPILLLSFIVAIAFFHSPPNGPKGSEALAPAPSNIAKSVLDKGH